MFDVDDNGTIDGDELEQVLRSLGHNPSKEEVENNLSNMNFLNSPKEFFLAKIGSKT